MRCSKANSRQRRPARSCCTLVQRGGPAREEHTCGAHVGWGEANPWHVHGGADEADVPSGGRQHKRWCIHHCCMSSRILMKPVVTIVNVPLRTEMDRSVRKTAITALVMFANVLRLDGTCGGKMERAPGQTVQEYVPAFWVDAKNTAVPPGYAAGWVMFTEMLWLRKRPICIVVEFDATG